MKKDVAVLIVTYNSADCIVPCINSIYEKSTNVSRQVIVVDNGSTDKTVEIIKSRFAYVTLIEAKSNLGFAAGVNLAAKKADAGFVLLLNPDTVVVNDAIGTIVEFARLNPQNGIYGGRTLTPDGSLEPSSCWAFPSLWSMGLFALGLSSLAPNSRLLNPEKIAHWQRDSVREVDVVTGCFLLASREAWGRLGGLDELFFIYGEDVDFAFRANAAGYRPLICPYAHVIHEVGESSDSKASKMRLLYRGKATLVRKHWNGVAKWLALKMLLTGTGLRALGGAITQPSRDSDWQVLWRERRDWIKGFETPSST